METAETQTLTNTETHEVITTDSTGNETSTKEIHTSETEVPATPAVETAPVEVTAEIEDEGAIDETWLTARFSELSAQISNLSQQLAANQVSNLETTNQLIAMNQSLQQTITELAARIPTAQSTPPLLLETPTPVIQPPVENAEGVAREEAKTEQKPAVKKRRRI